MGPVSMPTGSICCIFGESRFILEVLAPTRANHWFSFWGGALRRDYRLSLTMVL